jgi:hypothetical protein
MLVIAHSYTKDLAWIEIDFPFLKTKFRKEYSKRVPDHPRLYPALSKSGPNEVRLRLS